MYVSDLLKPVERALKNSGAGGGGMVKFYYFKGLFWFQFYNKVMRKPFLVRRKTDPLNVTILVKFRENMRLGTLKIGIKIAVETFVFATLFRIRI